LDIGAAALRAAAVNAELRRPEVEARGTVIASGCGTMRLPMATALIALLANVSCDRAPTAADPGYSHTLAPGASSADLIAGTDFNRLVVEVVHMPGHAPSGFALQQLAAFLNRWLDKAEIVIGTPRQIPSGGRQAYSAQDIRALEAEHRTLFSDPATGTLATFAVVVDGAHTDANVLGIAYHNTSTAYFGATIGRISGGLLQPARRDVETAIWRHEYGHLMGLVDIGAPMQQPHRDHPNGAHCTETACVMHHAFNNADLLANLLGHETPDLDAFCQADVRAVRD
jgi:hypothetical protein